MKLLTAIFSLIMAGTSAANDLKSQKTSKKREKMDIQKRQAENFLKELRRDGKISERATSTAGSTCDGDFPITDDE